MLGCVRISMGCMKLLLI